MRHDVEPSVASRHGSTRPGSPLVSLSPGQVVPFGGDRYAVVSDDLAARFRAGDRLVVVQETGDLLHVPAAVQSSVDATVGRAVDAFAALGRVDDHAITNFFDVFAELLADDHVFAEVARANSDDVERARRRGRSTTRLELTASMRADMITGLRTWRDAPGARDVVATTVEHDRWRVESRLAPLGVVGFVFEGRPNVFADAVGVVRTGNTVVFRIGSDALGTARAMMTHVVEPAVHRAGLPAGTVGLVDSAEHAAGWALFGDRRLALAVARGSGPAVAQLGAVARQSGVSVSLHGTGGAWIIAGVGADRARWRAAVHHSLDRKVCNTVNVVCVPASRAEDLVPELVGAIRDAAAARSVGGRLHVVEGSRRYVDAALFDERVTVGRADGEHDEPFASVIDEALLAHEWEWERSPEVSLVVVDDLDHAVALCNRYSPHFVVSVVSDREPEHDHVYATVDAPFVGDAFTRWVDGQYALDTPELGLSNWEGGRLLGRAAVLSGASVHTVRLRARVDDPELHR